MMKTRNGFTLIEMLFVILIIGILSSAASLAFIKNRERQNLQDGVQVVVDALTDVRNRAVAGWSVSDVGASADPTGEETVLPFRLGAWFSFDNPQYVILFADLNDDKSLTIGDDFVIDHLSATEFWSGYGVLSLPGEVNLQRIYGGVEDAYKEYKQAYFFYEVPTGLAYLRGATDAGGSVWEDDLDWMRVDVGLGTNVEALAENEMWKITVDKVGGYPYVCARAEEYNDSNSACF